VRKIKTIAVLLILLMSLGAYFKHMNPSMYPPSHATYRIANTLDRHTNEFDELTPEHREILTSYTETLMRSAKSAELHQRRANLPFAFVVAGVCLLSLMYFIELRKHVDRKLSGKIEKTDSSK